jgi:hypothetical protein
MSFGRLEITCAICNKSVDLKTSKIDDKGKAVHAECYFLSVIKHPIARPINRPNCVSESHDASLRDLSRKRTNEI